MSDNVCDGCDRDSDNLQLRAGRGLCQACVTVWDESRERALDDAASIIRIGACSLYGCKKSMCFKDCTEVDRKNLLIKHIKEIRRVR